jgi:prephenate dehydrogenase
VILDPAEHDRLVAYSSHLPQLLSTALASVLGEVEGVAGVTGPAALDMTRLAASPFSVWYDIFLTNRGNIEAALTRVCIQASRITTPGGFRGSGELNLSAPERLLADFEQKN